MKKQVGFWLGVGIAAGVVAFWRKLSRPGGQALPNQGIYRLYAPFYDGIFGSFYASPRRRTAQLLELKPGERLLISGVGTGLDLDNLPAGVDVLGVDISAEMLAQARLRPSARGARLEQMDAQRLDLPGGTFDAALLSLIVSVAPDGQAVFREAWRVLKPGGRLVLFDKFAQGRPGPLRRVAGAFFRLLGTDVNRRLMDIIGQRDDMRVEISEASLFGGQYRILRFRKLSPPAE